MTTYHANLEATTLHGAERSVRFKPVGKIQAHGDFSRENPATRRTGNKLIAARLFVGFNVDNRPVYTLEDVIDIFVRVREEQKRDAGASFLLQKGIYQPRGSARTEEDSAQIVVFNDEALPQEDFAQEMIELAEALAREMDQYEVYLDIQNKGITVESFTITPEK
jgi:hypothetical protein